MSGFAKKSQKPYSKNVFRVMKLSALQPELLFVRLPVENPHPRGHSSWRYVLYTDGCAPSPNACRAFVLSPQSKSPRNNANEQLCAAQATTLAWLHRALLLAALPLSRARVGSIELIGYCRHFRAPCALLKIFARIDAYAQQPRFFVFGIAKRNR